MRFLFKFRFILPSFVFFLFSFSSFHVSASAIPQGCYVIRGCGSPDYSFTPAPPGFKYPRACGGMHGDQQAVEFVYCANGDPADDCDGDFDYDSGVCNATPSDSEYCQSKAGNSEVLKFSPAGSPACNSGCIVSQSGDSTCTGTVEEGGFCTAMFTYSGSDCPDSPPPDPSATTTTVGPSSTTTTTGPDGSSTTTTSETSTTTNPDGSSTTTTTTTTTTTGADGTKNTTKSSTSTTTGGSSGGGSGTGSGGSGSGSSTVGTSTSTQTGPDGTTTGTGSSASASEVPESEGQCDPTDAKYAECVGFLDEVSDGLAGEIASGAEGDMDGYLDDYQEGFEDSFAEDTEGLGDGVTSSIESFIDSATSSLTGGSGSSCSSLSIDSPIGLIALDCGPFNEFRKLFAWALYILTAFMLFSIATRVRNGG